MTNPTSEPDDVEDQDAEPSLNAPEGGRPDGVIASDDPHDQDDDDADD